MASTQRRCLIGRWMPRVVLAAIGRLAYAVVVRPRLSQWRVIVEDASNALSRATTRCPKAAYVTTRAITMCAPAEAVWSWLVQLGQGCGGFYTYDRLEQMVGAGIRSADHIVAELQQLAIGDTVPL